MSEVSSSFCVLPWMHVFADELGVLYPCCRAVDSQLPNQSETGQLYRIQDAGGIEEGWNSAYMRTLRLGMLEGERPKPCERCYAIEDTGMQSYRQEQNVYYGRRIPELLASTGADGSVPLNFRSFDLRLGNLCNLRCRMCSPQSSRALIQEWADFYEVTPKHPAFDPLRNLDWFSDPGFWRIFEKHSAFLERLHFAGGEPFLIHQMFDFLEKLIELGRARNIRLSYNTNLTVLPERIRQLWPHFAQVRVTVSVDGFGEVNSYIRYPSNWAVIDRNLHCLDEGIEEFNCRGGLAFNTTVQLLNIFRLDEFLDYAARSFRHFEAPNLSPLRFPPHMSIRALPPEMKEDAAARLTGFLQRFDRWPDRWSGAPLQKLLKAGDGLVRYMMSGDESDSLPEFRRWTSLFDGHRNQRLAEVLPELALLCEEAQAAVQR